MIKSASAAILLTAMLVLSACNQRPSSGSDQSDGAEPPEAQATGAVSILRPEVAPPEERAQTFEPLEAVIGFPEGGDALDADAAAQLERVLASPQLALGGPITLRAHSDSAGTDTANENASEERGLAVATWLVGAGVDESRIEVIVFGEQNPAEPNALPDGSPSTAGRAANRRVEIEIQIPPESEIKNGADAAASEGQSSAEASD